MIGIDFGDHQWDIVIKAESGGFAENGNPGFGKNGIKIR